MRVLNKNTVSTLVLAVILALFSAILLPTRSQAAVGINQQISFQGKLVNTNGTNVADGVYNIQFKIYQDGTGCVSSGTSPCGGTLKWTETRLVSNTQGVAVTAGTFQVNLGSVNAFGANIDFNQDSLWLSMNVGGTNSTASPTYDGEMTPFIRFTAVPYALNAGTVGGLATSQLVQLSPGTQQVGTINVSGNIQSAGTLQVGTIDTAASGVLSVGSTNTTAITLGKNVTITSGQTLSAGGQTVFSGTGILQSAAFSGTYSAAVTLSNTTNSLAGTFVGNTVGAQYGGTGNASYAVGDLLYASSTTTLARLAAGTTGTCLKSNGAAAPSYASCAAAASSLQTAYNGGTSITQTAAGTISFTTGTTVPTADQLVIDNSGSSGVTTAGVNGASINYKGGAAAVEASGMRIDYTPGTTTGGTWSGLRIVAGATGPVSGVKAYGIKLEGPTSAGAGNETGVYIGSGWDIGIDVGSGGLQLEVQTDPVAPAINELRLYAKTIAGRVLPKWIGPSGVDTPVQASFGFNRIAMASPSGSGTTTATLFSQFGFTAAGAGTYSQVAPTSTNLNSSVRKSRVATAATATTFAYHSGGAAFVWRGNAAGLGGFFYTTRFSLSGTLATTNRNFIGLSGTEATPTAVDPTANTAISKIGIAVNSNTGNLKWISNVAGTTPTVVDIAGDFPINTTNLYELIMFSPPNGAAAGAITYRVKNLTTGSTTTDTVVSTNIPASTVFMTPMIWNFTSAASAVQLDSGGWYLESDN